MAGWEQDPASGLWWNGEDGPYDGNWTKVPWTPAELVAAAHSLALSAETAGLITLAPDGFPRCRTVTVGRHVAEDLSEVTVATRSHTRKCEEIAGSGKATVFWQDKRGTGAWLSAACEAAVEPGAGDKATLRLRPVRLELQDYNSSITGCGTDSWKPVILERRDGAWAKIQ
mmetsp:Transcript_13178/g.37646  ORF Transcript_13178/g.37646 Transcript_13178/m.37646 type:complete len:171 (+) Transcript_13178:53-565(+)